jgi:hypothetical protein
MIEIRDQTYDHFNQPDNPNKVDIEKLSKNKDLGYYLYLAGTFSTMTAMRLSRKI